MTRRAARRDANHAAVADAFRALGCTVQDLQGLDDDGVPDTLVGCMGVNHLCEIKNRDTAHGRAGLSPSQQRWARDWNGGRVWLAHTPDEAAALVQHWRTRSR